MSKKMVEPLMVPYWLRLLLHSESAKVAVNLPHVVSFILLLQINFYKDCISDDESHIYSYSIIGHLTLTCHLLITPTEC